MPERWRAAATAHVTTCLILSRRPAGFPSMAKELYLWLKLYDPEDAFWRQAFTMANAARERSWESL
jgi:hypothetical protein